jgi:hypothetical protein
MNSEIEKRARLYAMKVVLILLSIICVLVTLAYINILWSFVAVALFFVFLVGGALYNDAYYTKLMELERNERPNT